jgi:hypothetical protein
MKRRHPGAAVLLPTDADWLLLYEELSSGYFTAQGDSRNLSPGLSADKRNLFSIILVTG